VAPRLALLVACAALAVSAGACALLLDLPAPELADGGGPPIETSVPQPDASDGADDSTVDSSADTRPDQASRDTGTQDTSQDTAMEAAVTDAPPDSALDGGVLCSFTMSNYCDPDSSLPDCCETAGAGDAAPKLACGPLNCPNSGYDIECASASDCPGQKICCHYASGQRCESLSGSASTCPGSSYTQACDPGATGECPGNQNCTLQITNNGLPSPYWGCQ
jgi:hypothetical protein